MKVIIFQVDREALLKKLASSTTDEAVMLGAYLVDIFADIPENPYNTIKGLRAYGITVEKEIG